jgi:hypothetical protein
MIDASTTELNECHVGGVTAGRGQRGFEFNFSKVSRQNEGSNSTFSNSTFQKFPAKTRVRIQLFESFPPRRGFEFNFSKVFRQDEGSNSTFQKFPAKTLTSASASRQPPAASRRRRTTNDYN